MSSFSGFGSSIFLVFFCFFCICYFQDIPVYAIHAKGGSKSALHVVGTENQPITPNDTDPVFLGVGDRCSIAQGIKGLSYLTCTTATADDIVCEEVKWAKDDDLKKLEECTHDFVAQRKAAYELEVTDGTTPVLPTGMTNIKTIHDGFVYYAYACRLNESDACEQEIYCGDESSEKEEITNETEGDVLLKQKQKVTLSPELTGVTTRCVKKKCKEITIQGAPAAAGGDSVGGGNRNSLIQTNSDVGKTVIVSELSCTNGYIEDLGDDIAAIEKDGGEFVHMATLGEKEARILCSLQSGSAQLTASIFVAVLTCVSAFQVFF